MPPRNCISILLIIVFCDSLSMYFDTSVASCWAAGNGVSSIRFVSSEGSFASAFFFLKPPRSPARLASPFTGGLLTTSGTLSATARTSLWTSFTPENSPLGLSGNTALASCVALASLAWAAGKLPSSASPISSVSGGGRERHASGGGSAEPSAQSRSASQSHTDWL